MNWVIRRRVSGAYWNREGGWRAEFKNATVYPDLAAANKDIDGRRLDAEAKRHDMESRRPSNR